LTGFDKQGEQRKQGRQGKKRIFIKINSSKLMKRTTRNKLGFQTTARFL